MTKFHFDDGDLFRGDCREVLPTLVAESVDTVITDPPYELAFMDHQWDRAGVAFDPETWRQVMRVAKPGAMLLAFGGTRTFHRLVCAIEDTGWEIRDCLMWLYSNGMPKGVNLKVRSFVGYSSTLKPAWEPIVLAMKPFVGSFARNAEEHGVSGLNIDACRVPGEPWKVKRNMTGLAERKFFNRGQAKRLDKKPHAGGRWPTNVILSEPNLVGVASRFFYCAKPSKAEQGDNTHPTVKPLALMEYLVKLTASPTGGLVLDPFLGSGTTVVACRKQDRRFVGIEESEEYYEFARRRLCLPERSPK